MKKLTTTQVDSLVFKTSGANKHPVTEAISELQTEQSLFVSKGDWTNKSPFHILINQLGTRRGWKLTTRTLADKSGWVVTRIS